MLTACYPKDERNIVSSCPSVNPHLAQNFACAKWPFCAHIGQISGVFRACISLYEAGWIPPLESPSRGACFVMPFDAGNTVENLNHFQEMESGNKKTAGCRNTRRFDFLDYLVRAYSAGTSASSATSASGAGSASAAAIFSRSSMMRPSRLSATALICCMSHI